MTPAGAARTSEDQDNGAGDGGCRTGRTRAAGPRRDDRQGCRALPSRPPPQGARLVAFPEAFVPGYPDWVWRTRPWDGHAHRLYARLLDQAVVVGSACHGPAGRDRQAARHLAVGRRQRARRGRLDPLQHAAATSHRTGRWPAGTASSCRPAANGWSGAQATDRPSTVTDTGFGRLGGLICWENYMPLARAALYAQGVDIYLAPTWDNSDVWVPTLRHIAKEGRTYVIGVTACIRGHRPPGGPARPRRPLRRRRTTGCRAATPPSSAPTGTCSPGRSPTEEGIVYAEIDAAGPGPAVSSSTRSATTAAATSCA